MTLAAAHNSLGSVRMRESLAVPRMTLSAPHSNTSGTASESRAGKGPKTKFSESAILPPAALGRRRWSLSAGLQLGIQADGRNDSSGASVFVSVLLSADQGCALAE